VKAITIQTKEIKAIKESVHVGRTDKCIDTHFKQGNTREELEVMLLQCQDAELATLFVSCIQIHH
jgi:hypothetical protein